MDFETLQVIGLTKSEAKVYLSLLDRGQSTTGPLMSRAKVSASKIYSILDRLIEKGLVSFIYKGKRKCYQASPPEALRDYIRDREQTHRAQQERIEKLALSIEGRHEQEKQEARIFLGWKGVQAAYSLILDVLPRGSDFIGFVQPTKEEERRSVRIFYVQYHRKRMEKRYSTKLISNPRARRIFEREPYSSFRRFEVRYTEHCPSGLVVFADHIMMLAFEENPLAVVVRSQAIAHSYRKLFYSMWKSAKR